jgi:hypothetical protein
MHSSKFLMLAAIAGGCLATTNAGAQAQVSIDVGPAPECPYGYYDIAPYNCAPAGYYGPEWFSGTVFIGAGPWFHGAADFRGNVNNTYHPDHGYKGEFPNRGDRAEPAKRVTREHFKGNEQRDGRGHVAEPRH